MQKPKRRSCLSLPLLSAIFLPLFTASPPTSLPLSVDHPRNRSPPQYLSSPPQYLCSPPHYLSLSAISLPFFTASLTATPVASLAKIPLPLHSMASLAKTPTHSLPPSADCRISLSEERNDRADDIVPPAVPVVQVVCQT